MNINEHPLKKYLDGKGVLVSDFAKSELKITGSRLYQILAGDSLPLKLASKIVKKTKNAVTIEDFIKFNNKRKKSITN